MTITTIAFDADDTLWHNENVFEEYHRQYCELLSEYHDPKTVEKTLYATEMKNLELFGYGVKGFTLSCIETAIELTEGKISSEEIRRIIQRCREMLLHPVELLPGVERAVQQLSENYRLLVITKGDLRDQERKVEASGIAHLFDAVEVVSDKNAQAYSRVIDRHAIEIDRFLMVGNSLKSDILPILDLGGYAVHIPYRITWQHERVSEVPHQNGRFAQIAAIHELDHIIANRFAQVS